MTQDEIIRMAREAGWDEHNATYDTRIERFAALVAAHEKKFWMGQIEVECNEAVLAERNKQAEQKPVAWGCVVDGELEGFVPTSQKDINRNKGVYETPLYAAPVRKKDLTIAYMKGGDDMKRRMEKRMQQLESQLQLCQTAVADEREACAKVCDDYADKCVEAENWEAEDVSLHCAAAIRTKDLTDEYFVQSEVKSLRQQVAALKAVLDAWNNVEQEPVAKVICNEAGQIAMQKPDGSYFDISKHIGVTLYAAPVRTKDLTDQEIQKLRHKIDWTAEWSYVNFARAVIAADREKNK